MPIVMRFSKCNPGAGTTRFPKLRMSKPAADVKQQERRYASHTTNAGQHAGAPCPLLASARTVRLIPKTMRHRAV